MLERLQSFFNPETNGSDASWRVFWVALVVRLLYLTVAHTYRFRPYQDHFQFGDEAGRIARSLVEGNGYADAFANAYLQHTGPTAWLPPLYPLLVAAVFRVCGIYTALSAWVILAVNCVLSAFTAMAVWEIGFRFAGRRCAVWSGWLWALYPAAMQYAVRWVWEMTLTTALFAWVLVLALRMAAEPRRDETLRWVVFGLLWGLIALSNSTVLLFLPVCGVWVLRQTWQTHSLRDAAFAGVVFFACIAPWTVRNYRVFHTFIPLRGNFGAELCLGNGPGANGLLMEYNHPFQATDQLRLYQAMGEVHYVAMRGTYAKATIVADPAHFVADTVRRVYFFWASVPHPTEGPVFRAIQFNETFRVLNYGFLSLCGLFGLAVALRRHMPAAGLFAWAFLLLPLPYYIVTVHARFRHPLEPLICVLGVFLFQSAERGVRPRNWNRSRSSSSSLD